ncbi:Zn-dependent oxidoreductase [Nitzschia inconspicua]|uniref:Zn-dependent oxidoreductase n=1 Tax=Nitzschia inconspicua TaxID=303405 RepID=A0A9K3PJT7_9STRA|nr:Zn-dependent oxidoreductase [Nitzschia inconspicua]
MSSSPEIPEKMKQMVVLEGGSTVKECKLEIREVDVPKPQSHEVLVKMVAAAVNPSDYGSWKTAKKNDDGLAIGNEGSGIVVAIGSGLLTKARVSIGQKVGVVGPKNNQGTYSEYVTVSATDGFFPLPDDLPVEDGASFFVNPYTVLGIMDTAKTTHNSKALVHTAAASQLGQMMVKLSNNSELTNGVEIINVVRRAEQVKLLEELGAKHIINSSDSDWKDQLQTKIKELECTVAFDAVAGSSSGDILSCLPNGGTLYVYGGLAGSCRDINPMDLIYRRKDVKGFFLRSWVTSGGLLYTILRMAMAGRKVNAGLGKDGWASSQFKDVSLEKMQEECAGLLDSGATGIKLRVRFDE